MKTMTDIASMTPTACSKRWIMKPSIRYLDHDPFGFGGVARHYGSSFASHAHLRVKPVETSRMGVRLRIRAWRMRRATMRACFGSSSCACRRVRDKKYDPSFTKHPRDVARLSRAPNIVGGRVAPPAHDGSDTNARAT